MVLPVLLPGQEHPRAILVAAVSPMRALDDDYRTFFGLIATQIASALADAQALEEERRRAEALAELDRAKTTFFSNVSHEFRTPLTLMLGPLRGSARQTRPDLPARRDDAMDVAHRNGQRLLKLVNTLLDFSRIEAGRIDATYEPTDLAALTSSSPACSARRSRRPVSRWSSTARRCPSRSTSIATCGRRSSSTFSPTPSSSPSTARSASPCDWHGDHVELRVSDTGVGIADCRPAAHVRAFPSREARPRTDARRHRDRSGARAGAGPASRRHGRGQQRGGPRHDVRGQHSHRPRTCRRIGSRAARQLTSTSVGAIPYVEEALRWLPGMRRRHAGSARRRVERPNGGGDRRHASALLVADDNADMRDYLARILGQQLSRRRRGDGRAALDRIASRPARPGPHRCDDAVARWLWPAGGDPRRTSACESVPVILLSARAGEEARIEGLHAGADDYLVKPFSARELLASVASQLRLVQAASRLGSGADASAAGKRRRHGDAERRRRASSPRISIARRSCRR